MNDFVFHDRVYYYDWLRAIATIGVIFLHVSAENLNVPMISSLDWHAMNIYDSAFRWCVPVFLMISGSLLLDKEFSLDTLIRRIKRLVIAFVFWSIIYAMFAYDGSEKELLFNVIKGHHHMWFIPMIIGCYISIPVIQKIVCDSRLARYVLWFGNDIFMPWRYILYLRSW